MNESNTPTFSPHLVRLALGLVYFHFGLLKLFPDLSPAELIAGETLTRVLDHWLSARSAVWWLGVMECSIGIGLLFNVFKRLVFSIFLVHMIGTFLPLVLVPEWTFKIAPFALTLEGQYILKNLVFVAAGWTVLRPWAWPSTNQSGLSQRLFSIFCRPLPARTGGHS